MKINGIKYSKKFNLGNYESEDIGVDVSVEEGENPSECLKAAMDFVSSKGGSPVMEEKPVVAAKKKVEKAEPKKEAEQLELAAAEHEETVATMAPAPKVEEKERQKPGRKREKELPVTPEEKATHRTVVKTNIKSTVYDRNLDLHKKLVAELLDASYPNWKANPSKAKEASIKLEGKEFLDNEGIILAEFKALFAEAMK